MLKGILTVGGWTMASRVLGFVRDMLIAARLGAGPLADAFFVALQLPNLFRRLFGEGAFNAAFIPAFAGTLATQGPQAARDLAERMLALMAVWLSSMVVLGILVMPQLMGLLAPGFAAVPAKLALAVELTRITFPYLLFICLTALVSGVLNGLDRFAAAAAAPIFFNLVSMATLLALTPYVATPAHALAWGVTASGVVQLGLVLWATARAGMALRILRPPSLTPEVRAVLRRMGPGVLGAGVTQLNVVVGLMIASVLPAGAVSYLYYADRIGQLPLGVIGAAVGTALLPLLSRQLRAGERLSAHRSMNRAIEFALVLCLPAAVGQAAAALPLVETLFQRGAFGPAETAGTAAALSAYALGLPAFVLVKVFAPGFFARGDTAAPVRIGVATVAVNIVLNLLLSRWFSHVGVAVATTLSAWFNVVMLGGTLVKRGQLLPDRRLRRRTPRLLSAALLMGAALVAGERLMFPVASGPLRLLALAALVGGGAAVYFGAAHLLRGFDLREFRALLRRRRPPGAAPAAA